MSSAVRWLFSSCFLFGGGAGLWDGGKSILQVKERLVVRGQEEGVSYTRTGWILCARRVWLCLSPHCQCSHWFLSWGTTEHPAVVMGN